VQMTSHTALIQLQRYAKSRLLLESSADEPGVSLFLRTSDAIFTRGAPVTMGGANPVRSDTPTAIPPICALMHPLGLW